MKDLKLLQILPSLESGGVEQGTVDVANYLASMELNSFIISNGGSLLSPVSEPTSSTNELKRSRIPLNFICIKSS